MFLRIIFVKILLKKLKNSEASFCQILLTVLEKFQKAFRKTWCNIGKNFEISANTFSRYFLEAFFSSPPKKNYINSAKAL